MKRVCVLLLTALMLIPAAHAAPAPFSGQLSAASALLMEKETGTVLYEKQAHAQHEPASVTKVMTLLLIWEALDSGRLDRDESVTVSANAAGMGGSQVYLKEGEQFPVWELVKCVTVASANDAALALAEAVSGSEEAFVRNMNQRAAELGMKNTVFENTNGLDDTAKNHVTSARDIAIMSRELIRHKEILTFSSTWMDTVRNGAFGLTNTNRLVRFYRGCNGLKTGSTAKAGFCVSATAERDGMTLICVIMGAANRDMRNAAAASLLDWGFANYALYTCPAGNPTPVRVPGGIQPTVGVRHAAFSCVLPRADLSSVEKDIELPEAVPAPVKAGDTVGKLTFTCRGVSLGEVTITADADVGRIGFGGILRRLLARFFLI